MSGNGKDLSGTFYQEGDKPKQHGNRYYDNLPLTEEGEAIVNAVLRGMKCGKQCLIPDRLKPHLEHGTTALEDIGEGSVAKGISSVRDQHRVVDGFIATHNSVVKQARNTAIGAFVLGLLGLIWWAMIHKAQGG